MTIMHNGRELSISKTLITGKETNKASIAYDKAANLRDVNN